MLVGHVNADMSSWVSETCVLKGQVHPWCDRQRALGLIIQALFSYVRPLLPVALALYIAHAPGSAPHLPILLTETVSVVYGHQSWSIEAGVEISVHYFIHR